jgi:hypothetical protein
MMPHARNDGAHDERTAGILRRRAAGLMGLDDAVAELADADGAAAIAVMIADRVRLQPEMVSRALEADSDEAISVLCRAAGLRINSYSALLRMRRRRHRGLDSAPSHALMYFSDLSPASAETLLRRFAALDAGERQV